MDARVGRRSAAILGVLVMVVAACSAAPAPSGSPIAAGAEPSPTVSRTPTPTASPSPRPQPTPEPSYSYESPEPTPSEEPIDEDPVEPEPSPTPVPAPPDGALIVDWSTTRVDGLPEHMEIRGATQSASTWLLAGSEREEMADGNVRNRGGIWRSEPGGRWEAVLDIEDGWVNDVAAFDAGFVAVGTMGGDASVWLSNDGRRWRAVDDEAFAGGQMSQVGVTSSGFVAFGYGRSFDTGVIWTSPDGEEWLRATNASGLRVARGLKVLVRDDGRLTAFVGPRWDEQGSIEIWSTTGRAEWQRVGTLPRSDDATVSNAAHGPKGWVAVGRLKMQAWGPGVAWRSDDGKTWQRLTTGPDTATAMLADEAGFIAAGFTGGLPGETCGDPRPFRAQTWTSTDGGVWREMPRDASFDQAFIVALFQDARGLAGLGLRFDDGEWPYAPTAWSAALPGPSDDDAPPSDPSAAEQGCGD